MDPSPAISNSPPSLEDRLLALWELTGEPDFLLLSEGKPPQGQGEIASEQERMDAISSCLMDCYKRTGDGHVFSLLFELNRTSFLAAIRARVRRSGFPVDPQDVLQEVFLNIYRYPRRFVCERSDSFRNWGHRIVRNTLLKFIKGESRRQHFASFDDDLGQRPDRRTRTPARTTENSELAKLVDFAYLVYLNLYLQHYRRLSAKEQRALRMVEVDGASYKATAAALGIRLENLKMVIFRGRRKIFRGLHRTLRELSMSPPRVGEATIFAPCPTGPSRTGPTANRQPPTTNHQPPTTA